MEETDHEQQQRGREERLRYIELRRLLYCMQHQEGLPKYEEEDTPKDSMDAGGTVARYYGRRRRRQHQQSWRSLLFRAQLCQDLWHQVAHDWSSSYGNGDDDDDDDDGDHPKESLEEYHALSKQVDVACRRARELADEARILQEERNKRAWAEQHDDKEYKGDLVERIFSSSANNRHQNHANDQAVQGEAAGYEDDIAAILEEDEMEEFEEDESSYGEDRLQRPNGRANNNNVAISMEELQQSQRDQMEEAISQMARQMKDATRGIQSRIQQQTKSTLNELETVAEQNVQDVTQVAQNVSQHNSNTRRANWATWTMIFSLVAVFCFSLITIFTIPKSPHACLFLCAERYNNKNDRKSWPRRLLGKASNKLGFLSTILADSVGKRLSSFRIGHDDDEDKLEEKNEDDTCDADSGSCSQIYDEDELERQEKERLDELVRSMKRIVTVGRNEKETGSSEKPATSSFQDSTAHDTADAHSGRKTTKAKEDSHNDRKTANKNQADGSNQVPEVNVDEIFASLKKRVDAEQAGEQVELDLFEMEKAAKTNDFPTGASLDPALVAHREGDAKQRFSPKDFRVAAASNDFETLQRYLSLSPEFIDRTDKYGWTALYLATRSGHERIVRLLLENGSDPNLQTKAELTAVEIAMDKLGAEHPATLTILEFIGDVKDNDDSDEPLDEEDEEERVYQEANSINEAPEEERHLAEDAERRMNEERLAEKRRVDAEEERRLKEEEEHRWRAKEDEEARIDAEEERIFGEEKRAKEEEKRRLHAKEEEERRKKAEEERLAEDKRIREEEELRLRATAEEVERQRLEEERLAIERRLKEETKDERRRREQNESRRAKEEKRRKLFALPPAEDAEGSGDNESTNVNSGRKRLDDEL